MPKFNTHTKKKILEEFEVYLDAVSEGLPYSRFHQTGLGPVAEIEKYFAEYFECPYALSFSSATNALTSVALSLNLKKDDEVIVAPYNWGSSIGGLMEFTDCKIIVADTDSNECICPKSVEELITNKTNAVWACDFEGQLHDTKAIRRICDDHDLFYVADASQSFGQRFDDIPASGLADAIALSFGSGKPIDAGEGGMLITRKSHLFQDALSFLHPYRSILEQGIEFANEFYPINGRISPFSAIMVNMQMKSLK
jgi:dTDP-4-amino-4,6-dideoxygalactose transaminase